MKTVVAVFGATGAQGFPVVKRARLRGLEVRAVARNAEAVRARFGDEVQAAAADLADVDAIAVALNGVQAAFFHLPIARSPDEPARFLSNFLRAAQQVRLPQLVFTTSGSAGARYRRAVLIDGNTQAAKAVLAGPVPAVVLQPTLYLENLQVPLFVPLLHQGGILDYPPLLPQQKLSWTSHWDQAEIAVAALQRPDLAGRSFEIASVAAVTGGELAQHLEVWTGKAVVYRPLTPAQFGARVAEALANPGVAALLAELYEALQALGPAGMQIETEALERTFDVKLQTVAQRIGSWAAAQPR